MSMRQILLPIFIFATLSLPTKILAHGTKISYENTEAIVIKATYNTGEPMGKAQISVYTPDNPSQPWLTGTTDEKGRFLFQPDSTTSGNWEVKVRHLGHGGVVKVPVTTAQPKKTQQTQPTASPNSSTPEQVVRVPESDIHAERVSAIEYTPVQRGLMIASVIWGCVGTALFFLNRKKNAHI
ncbi:MAG: carboxypeptidase-like regulatory domain-containing protein [Cyanobacteria bacterium J06636_27]